MDNQGRRRSLGPGHSAGVEQHSQAVVDKEMEAVADALDLLDEEVQAFGRPAADTREVMGEDLGSPGVQGPAQAPDLRHQVLGAGRDRLVEEQCRLFRILARVDDQETQYATGMVDLGWNRLIDGPVAFVSTVRISSVSVTSAFVMRKPSSPSS